MHAEPALMEQVEEMQSGMDAEIVERQVARCFGNIMDVLMPAKPPVPKNARIVRQFDLEAAKTDSHPVQVEAAPERARPERRSREETRALRNRSLAAAAGLTD